MADLGNIENCFDEAFDLKSQGYEVFLDLSTLLRMDSISQMNFYSLGVQRGIFAPNEARAVFNYKPVTGGDTPYMQQQNYSLEAISKRDAKENPFESSAGKSKGDDDGADNS